MPSNPRQPTAPGDPAADQRRRVQASLGRLVGPRSPPPPMVCRWLSTKPGKNIFAGLDAAACPAAPKVRSDRGDPTAHDEQVDDAPVAGREDPRPFDQQWPGLGDILATIVAPERATDLRRRPGSAYREGEATVDLRRLDDVADRDELVIGVGEADVARAEDNGRDRAGGEEAGRRARLASRWCGSFR